MAGSASRRLLEGYGILTSLSALRSSHDCVAVKGAVRVLMVGALGDATTR
jgi:hypothetical protein